MPRQWGATRAYVRELNQIPSGVNFSYAGQQYLTNVVPNSATWNRLLSQIGNGSARFYPTQNWDKFLVPGRVLVVEQPVSGYSGFLVRTITCFLIEDVEPTTKGEVEVRGPGVETLLARKPRFSPIGEERVYTTAIAPQNQLPARTTLATGVPSGNQSAALTNATGIEIGEGLRIRKGDNNDGTWHVATVTGKSGNTVNFSPAMSGQAAAGNSVQGWPASGGEAAHAPIVTTLTQGAPAGMDAATLATTDGIVVGDEVRIRTGTGNGGPWFSGRVRTVNPQGAPYPNTIQFDPDLTADAPVGNSVEIRAGWLRVYDPTGYAEGQRVVIDQNSGADRETVVTDVDGDGLAITIRDGLTAAANIGNAVTAYDYGARTTADVTQAMATAPDWQVTFQTGNGSSTGTSFAPKGESVFDILLSIADRTGEFFRYSLDASGIPTKRIEWRRSADTSNVTLILYDNDEYARQRANELDATKGAAFSIRKRTSFPLITRIYPSAGDQTITLASCSEEALLYAAVEGFTVHISDDFYEPDYVEWAAGVANPKVGVQAIRQTYGDISIDDATNNEQLVAASDQLLLSAIQELFQAQMREYYTVEAYIPVALKPGQTVKIENATRVEPTVSTATNYIILEVNEKQVNGRSRTTLTVSNMLGLRRTGANTLGGILRSTVQSLRRVGGGGGNGANISVTGGVVGSHAHAEYIPLGGGVTLVGNLDVAPNVTIDGVDISAHAANPAAHHAPVTLIDNGLRTTGNQAIGLRLSAVAPGVQIRATAGQEGLGLLLQSPSGMEVTASGLALADAVAGEGLKLLSKTLHLDLASPSGLAITADRLALAMLDSDLSATSSSALRVAGHGHRIINSSDGQTSPATLLSSGASGQLRLAGLALGAAWTGTDALLIQTANASQTATRLRGVATQTAPLWRVENNAGQALLLVTAGGDLESGNPAFVSRVSGWQLEQSGDAELNNVFIRGELHATTFVADEMHATGGTMAVMTAAKISKPQAAGQNVLPAIGSNFTLNTQASWDTGLPYFAVNDIVRVKPMGEIVSGGGLDLYDIYAQVGAVGALTGRNLANGDAGYYPMTVTRRYGGETGFKVPPGSAAVRWARTHNVGYTGGMILTSDLPYSPYLDIFTIDATQTGATWQAAPVLPIPRVRLGNLRGVLGKSADEWGLAAGTNLSATGVTARYIVASDTGLLLNNVDLKMYNGSTPVVSIDNNGNMKLGSDLSAGATTTLEFTAATGQLRVGPLGAGTANLFWGGAALHLRQNATPIITLDSDGSSYFAGVMSIGTSGGIWQATGGTFAEPRGGLKIWNVGGVGRMATYDSGGAKQVEFDSTGALKAAAGILALDKLGLHVYHAPGGDEVVRLRGQGIEFIDTLNFSDSYGVRFFRNEEEYGQVQGIYFGATERWVRLRTNVPSNQVARTQVHAVSGTRTATIQVSAATASTAVTMAADSVTVDGALILPQTMRFLPRTTKPSIPSGYAGVYAYQTGSNYQFILRNAAGAEVVMGTIAAA
jgi:hypothetical protein